MNNPLVSVIVTTYNQQTFIAECLDGILSQKTDFDFEILVGNDCSTDMTADIIKTYAAKDERVKLYTPSENLVSTGQSLSHTLLIPVARGKYIAFCEGDDYWTDPYKLQVQANFLENNTDYSACYHDYDSLSDGVVTLIRHGKRDCDAHLSDMVNLMHCQLSSLMVRSECLRTDNVDIYFQHPKHCYGDINYYASCFEFGNVRYIARKMSIYRQSHNSLTATDRKFNASHEKHIGGLTALVDVYGTKIQHVVRDYMSCQVLGRSSIAKGKPMLFSILLKIKAFFKSPAFVSRVYMIKWGLK